MSRNKTPKVKMQLATAIKQNRRIPVFVVAKTKRRITVNQKRRHWRSRKLKIKKWL